MMNSPVTSTPGQGSQKFHRRLARLLGLTLLLFSSVNFWGTFYLSRDRVFSAALSAHLKVRSQRVI